MYYEAKALAMGNGETFHVAAILFRGKSVIRLATNSRKTHPKQRRIINGEFECAWIHAEVDALRWARPGDTLVVIRYGRSGNLAVSKPCEYCMREIIRKGIRVVRYIDIDGSWKKMKIRRN